MILSKASSLVVAMALFASSALVTAEDPGISDIVPPARVDSTPPIASIPPPPPPPRRDGPPSCPDYYQNMTFFADQVAFQTPFPNFAQPAVLLGRIDVTEDGFPVPGSHLGVYFPGTDDFTDKVILVVGHDEKTYGFSGSTAIDMLVGDLENIDNILVNGVLTPLADIPLYTSPDPASWSDEERIILAFAALWSTDVGKCNIAVDRATYPLSLARRRLNHQAPGFWCKAAAVTAGAVLAAGAAAGCGVLLAGCAAGGTITFGGVTFLCTPIVAACTAGALASFPLAYSFVISQWSGGGGAGGHGDPHFRTWIGQKYDFHGQCDLILVQSRMFALGQGLDIHIRTTIQDDFSYISGIAIRIGEEILEIASHGVRYLNGVVGAAMPTKISGFPVSYMEPSEEEHVFDVAIDQQQRLVVKSFKDYCSVSIVRGKADNFADAVGLLGSFGTGSLLAKNGTKMAAVNPNDFGMEWQVAESSIFQDKNRTPQYPQECLMPEMDATAAKASRRLGAAAGVDEKAAETVCADKGDDIDSCMFDVLATGDLSMAKVY